MGPARARASRVKRVPPIATQARASAPTRVKMSPARPGVVSNRTLPRFSSTSASGPNAFW